MTLDVDLSRPPRSFIQQVELIRAIMAAAPEDEGHFVEWKSDLDLSRAAGQAAAAKTIIGMANRPVELAATVFEGVGIMAIGVEPGRIVGTTPLDSAPLFDWMKRYLGPQQPAWSAVNVQVDGVTVLLITVEAPRAGDPIYTLAKDIQEDKRMIRNGTVLVRKGAQSVSADYADMQSLEARLLRRSSTPEMTQVSTSWDVEDPFSLDFRADDDALDEAVEAERQAVHVPMPKDAIARSTGFRIMGSTPTREEVLAYRAEVKPYLLRYRKRLYNYALDKAHETFEDLLPRVVVANGGDETLLNVQATVSLPEGLDGLCYAPGVDLPTPPQRPDVGIAGLIHHPLNIIPRRVPPPFQRDGNEFTFELGDLHPGRRGKGLPFLVVHPPAESFTVWSLPVRVTASNMRGAAKSTLELPVSRIYGLVLLDLVRGYPEEGS